MGFKRFDRKDIIHNTIVAKPEFNFIVHSGTVYLQNERIKSGDFSNNIKHISSGDVSLYEINVNRPSDSMVHSFIEKHSTRYAYKTVSTSEYDDRNQFPYGSKMTQSYPLTASISRIYIPAGQEFNDSESASHHNKRYIRALKGPISSCGALGPSFTYGTLGTDAVNMICIPSILCGSSLDKGSVRLDYHVTGTTFASAVDLYGDGRLIQVSGTTTGHEVGVVVYNQGIIILTSSVSLHAENQDSYFSTSSNSAPSWLNFGTGIHQAGAPLAHGVPKDTSCQVNYRGVNKIPTLTMFAYSKIGEHNYSHNPTFLKKSTRPEFFQTGSYYVESEREIKKINKSPYSDNEDRFENVTYISKIGIYDKDKNLIGIATLANPVKKTETRDFMFKMKMDF